MIDLEEYLYNRVKNEIDSWNAKDIYAISFFVYSNEAYTYKDFENVSIFTISYNTESACENDDLLSEERWNYAYWFQDEIPIIDPTEDYNEGTEILFKWYEQNGIKNIGYEDEDCYDKDMNYVGKGPVGYYELLTAVSNVAKRLQEESYIKNKFGKPIPIIIHDYEYSWYVIEATKNANPHGEADTFIKAMKQLGFID
ncbi:MAG: hypothetical protein GYA50_08535 [Eubacteriaceae bacterium]|nr:hypothetical protein [Eubacteriaceae bacterium]